MAQELTDRLRARGFSIWFDEYELRVGDSLRQKIDQGLLQSRHGIVVLSENFFGKRYPESELDGLTALGRRILPVWHEVDSERVKQYSPTLAGIRATKTKFGLDRVAQDIAEVIHEQEAQAADISAEHRQQIGSTTQAAQRLTSLIAESRPLVEAEIQHRRLYPAYLEVVHTPASDHRWEVAELMGVAERSMVRRTGWPIGVVLHRDVARPRPDPNHISAMIYSDTFRRSVDYWRLERDGAYYFARTFGEDEREGATPGAVLNFDIRIWRVAEAFEHASRLYHNFGVSPDERIYFHVRHAGLAGRNLTASDPSRYIRPIPREIVVPDVVWRGEPTLNQIDIELRKFVRAVCGELFLMFDFFQLGDAVLDDVLNRYLASRV